MIKEKLLGKTNKEKQTIKAIEMKKAIGKNLNIKDKDNKDVEITNIRVENGVLWCEIKVDGVYLNGDGIYGFANPPFMITNGTKKIKDELTDVDVDVFNYVEDADKAFEQIVLSVIGGD